MNGKRSFICFFWEQSLNSIAEQTGFEQRRVLRALTKIRLVMTKDIPEIFSCTVEVDVHRLVNHGERQYSDVKGSHINGLEGFWGLPETKISSKGGIRKERLHLSLGEYVWRCNHRSDPERIKMRRLIQLLEKVWC